MNFGAGPAALPLPVLEEAQAELLDFRGTGMSVLEISHRSPEYLEVHEKTIANAKELLGIGDDFEVLLLGGGATAQFAMLPMNALWRGRTGDCVITGSWAQTAYAIAAGIGKVHIAATTENAADKTFTRIPRADELSLARNAAYLHLTSNNTIFGTQWRTLPKVETPLAVDMSSDILSRPLDVSRCAVIYAGAQKNLGPAGVTLIAIRKGFLAQCDKSLPIPFSYRHHAEKKSLSNTPPCFAIYMVGKMLEWAKNEGGLAEMERRNRRKAELLYLAIDSLNGFIRAPVERESRSWMNVVFRLATPALEERFLTEAEDHGMTGLRGHRSVGGIRASIYNGVPLAWVESLASFMLEFARRNG
jgi:phosphoserine aminotransferase